MAHFLKVHFNLCAGEEKTEGWLNLFLKMTTMGLKEKKRRWNNKWVQMVLIKISSVSTKARLFLLVAKASEHVISMTRLGNLLHFGQPFKAFGKNKFAQIIFGQLLLTFGDFFLVTLHVWEGSCRVSSS